MARIVIELPTASYEQLQQRARAAGTSPEALSRELLEAALGASTPPEAIGDVESATLTLSTDAGRTPVVPAGEKPTEPLSAREALQAAGLHSELSPELRKLIIPGVTLEDVHEIFRNTEGPSLSDIIIEQRGPKD